MSFCAQLRAATQVQNEEQALMRLHDEIAELKSHYAAHKDLPEENLACTCAGEA